VVRCSLSSLPLWTRTECPSPQRPLLSLQSRARILEDLPRDIAATTRVPRHYELALAQMNRRERRLAGERPRYEVDALTDAGDSVLVAVRRSGRGAASGVRVEERRYHVWDLTKGRAVRSGSSSQSQTHCASRCLTTSCESSSATASPCATAALHGADAHADHLLETGVTGTSRPATSAQARPSGAQPRWARARWPCSSSTRISGVP
jgi:hypothetical protein